MALIPDPQREESHGFSRVEDVNDGPAEQILCMLHASSDSDWRGFYVRAAYIARILHL